MKVLINGPAFYNYNEMIAKGFKESGAIVETLNWPNINGNILYHFKLSLYKKINRPIDDQVAMYKYMYRKILEYNTKLLNYIDIFDPDVLITLKGDILFPDTIRYIKEKTDTISVIWCYDSAQRYENVLNSGKYYDLFYTFEPSDIPILKKYKVQANFLPMAYDPDSYNLKNKIKDIDIAFIGNLNLYPSRKKLLEEIIQNNQNLEIKIWGKSWTWYNPILQYEYKLEKKHLSKCINNYNIDSNTINNIYNSSKICLNVHHPQSVDGLNPRTFEILGSGGFELVDYKPILDNLFDIGTEIEYYRNKKELLQKIDYYMKNDDEREIIAEAGHKQVIENHTYKNRASEIIKDVECL